MKVLITQSNYIPWKGYFDSIAAADHFIIFDDMQFTKRDWRNRNQIRTAQGTQWLTIPVEVKGKYHQRIRDTKISDTSWARSHWDTIRHTYSKAPYFKDLKDFFENIYLSSDSQWLSEVNYKFLTEIMNLIGIKTEITWSNDYQLVEGKTERLVDLCVKKQASVYLSGPSAKDYLDESLFTEKGISVKYFNFSGYPQYQQLHDPFIHGVSVIDLLFCTGAKSSSLIFVNSKTEEDVPSSDVKLS